jgi:hypothetical protein
MSKPFWFEGPKEYKKKLSFGCSIHLVEIGVSYLQFRGLAPFHNMSSTVGARQDLTTK